MDQRNDGLTFMGIKEMAKKLDVPPSWIYSRTRIGQIPHYKMGKYVKFVEAEVMDWLKHMQGGDKI